MEELNRRIKNLEAAAVALHSCIQTITRITHDPHGITLKELYIRLCTVRGELSDNYHDLLMELESVLIHTRTELLDEEEEEE